jgi:hypothetical protein
VSGVLWEETIFFKPPSTEFPEMREVNVTMRMAGSFGNVLKYQA